jgi:uncharacterized membrane protein YfcA
MSYWLPLIITGFLSGVYGGLAGLGGGIILIPALVFFFGFSQHMAQGTTLAVLLPPIGILAVMTYFQKGFVDVKAAIFLCLGSLLGGWLGSKIAVNLPAGVLQKVFGVILLCISIKMLFFNGKN